MLALPGAASQVAALLAAHPNYAAHIQAPRVSADGHSALVTFQVPGNVTNIGQAVSRLQHAVAGVQARHPDLRVAETGDASMQQAIDSSLNFGKAETTSVPITLILLLAVFGSLVAAGSPAVLALTALTAAIGVVTMVSHWLPVNGNTFEVVGLVSPRACSSSSSPVSASLTRAGSHSLRALTRTANRLRKPRSIIPA